MSNEKSPGCLGYIGGYTTLLYWDIWDYNKLFLGSLLNNQDSMESKKVFLRGSE